MPKIQTKIGNLQFSILNSDVLPMPFLLQFLIAPICFTSCVEYLWLLNAFIWHKYTYFIIWVTKAQLSNQMKKMAMPSPCGRLKFLLEENIVQRVIQAAHWKSQLNSSTTADTLYSIHILLSLGKFQSLITSVRSFYLHAWKFTEAKTSTSGENGLFVYELFYSFYKTNVY